MKKLVKSFVILAVVAIALGSASAVFAQSSTPETPTGFGSRGNRGGMGSGSTFLNQNRDSFEDGLLHDEMIAAFAEALDLDVEVVETRLADGETMAEIALSTGLTLDEFRTVLKDVRTQVHEWAVEEGILPEAQGPRGGMGRFGGMKGDGQGLYGSGECIND
jgi:hypothetical protein